MSIENSGSAGNKSDHEENNEELERFFSVNPDLMIITDREANFVKLNQSWEKNLGYSLEELKRHKYFDFIHLDDLAVTRSAIENLTEGQQLKAVNRCRHSDGTYRYLEWHARLYGNFIYGTARDITESVITEDFLEKEKEFFNTTLNTAGVGIIAADNRGRIVLMNQMAELLTGWNNDDALLMNFGTVFETVDMKTKGAIPHPVATVLKTGHSLDTGKDVGIVAKNGAMKYISGNANPIRSANGEIDGVVVSFRDITKEYSLKKEIEGFLNVNLDMLCVADRHGNFHKVNKKFEEILGYKAEEIEGKNLSEFLHQDDLEKATALQVQLAESAVVNAFVCRFRCKDGSYKFIEWNTVPGIDNFIYASARDVTQKMMQEDRLQRQASRDDLTGLFNRHYFDTVITEMMEHSDLTKESLSFLLIDLDHFKRVNDTWGHPIGDDFLKMISDVLQRNIRSHDLLARFGGEEFAVVLPNTDLSGAIAAAEKLRGAVEKKHHPITGAQTISIGVSERMRAESFRLFYRRTDEALYRAKQGGRNRVVASKEAEVSPKSFLHIDWMKDWESGEKTIDEQHKKLIEIANQFVTSSLEDRDSVEIMDRLHEIIVHIADHFDSEEKILREISYSDYQNHKKIHEDLTAKALGLESLLKEREIRPSAFFSFLLDDVVLGHLVNEDTKFFPCIRGQRESVV